MIDNHQYKILTTFNAYYQGKLNNTKGCEEDDRNDGQDDPQEEETRFFLWIVGDSRYD